MRLIRASTVFLLVRAWLSCLLLAAGCRCSAKYTRRPEKDDDIKIGFSMGTLQESGGSGRDILVAEHELGAEVIILNAYNDSEEQIRQTGYLIEQGIDTYYYTQ